MTTTETKAGEKGAVSEPTVAKPVYMPRTDIYETAESVVVVADMPGVDERSVEITLEKNVLTIRGTAETSALEGYKGTYAEYGEGNYERAFTLSDEVSREGIQASAKNGVLRLTLPKAGPVQARKIELKAS